MAPCQPVGGPVGDMGRPAEGGAELESCPEGAAAAAADGGSRNTDPMEPRCDRLGSEDCGVNSTALAWEVNDSRRAAMGRNRSLVRSKISEPIAPMADEYLSRRSLDSLTTNSANSLTLSASVDTDASFCAKAWKRSMLPRQNWSDVCLTTASRVIVREGERGGGTGASTEPRAYDDEAGAL